MSINQTAISTLRRIKPVVWGFRLMRKCLKKGKWLACRFFQRTPLIAKERRVPNDYWETATNYIESLNKSAMASLKTIYKGEILKRKKPRSIGRLLPRFEEVLRHNNPAQYPSSYVLTLKDGRVSGRNGSVITLDNKLLWEVSIPVGTEKPKYHPIFSKARLRQPQIIKGKVAVMAASGGEKNYFHWLFDVLPRLHLIEKSGFRLRDLDYIYINPLQFPFHKETVEKIGIPNEKLIFSSEQTHIQAETLIVPSLGNTGNPFKWACTYLVKALLSNRTSNFGHKVFISRKKAPARRIANEDELAQVLQEKDFHFVTLEDLSVQDQAALMHNAKIVIAPHGAGLSNIVFCKPGTKVVEIFPPEFVNLCYWSLADTTDLDYGYLIGEKTGSPDYDFTVSLNKILAVL